MIPTDVAIIARAIAGGKDPKDKDVKLAYAIVEALTKGGYEIAPPIAVLERKP